MALAARQLQEREIAQLKKLLEFHVVELKARETDSKVLKDQSAIFKDIKLALEIKQQEIVDFFVRRRGSTIPMHNIRRLKVLVLDRCQEINEDIAQDASQLTGTRAILRGHLMSPKEEKHFQLLACKFDHELVELQADMASFNTMYDSDLKAVLQKHEQVWKENAETRYRLLKNLTQELIEKCDILIGCNTEEMAALIKIKESHLETIEDLNGKLRGVTGKSMDNKLSDEVDGILLAAPVTTRVLKARQQPLFSSLGEQLEGLRLAPDSIELPDKKADGSPRYGRKKMAWC